MDDNSCPTRANIVQNYFEDIVNDKTVWLAHLRTVILWNTPRMQDKYKFLHLVWLQHQIALGEEWKNLPQLFDNLVYFNLNYTLSSFYTKMLIFTKC